MSDPYTSQPPPPENNNNNNNNVVVVTAPATQTVIITTPTSTGIHEGLLALLAYPFTWITGLIVLLVETRSNYCRYHGAQAIALFICYLIVLFPCIIIDVIIANTCKCLYLFNVFTFLAMMGLYAIIIFCMIKAYAGAPTQDIFKLPLVHRLADSIYRSVVGEPPVVVVGGEVKQVQQEPLETQQV